jgi:hypothetical protein
MIAAGGGIRFSPRRWGKLAAVFIITWGLWSCTISQPQEGPPDARLRETASLVRDVKAFGKTLGIEPTAALSQTTQTAPALSMLWLWMQRLGTLASRTPVDILMAIGFSTAKEQLKLEQVYRVDGYSVYYRQGNEFADARAVATIGFADEGTVRRVKVILHEDLHGDQNFDLPWDIEESIVTPLGSLAAVEFFKQKGDGENLKRALLSMDEEREFSRELNGLVKEAGRLFKTEPLEQAKRKILALMASYPIYSRQFRRQIAGQNSSTVLEAKLSHDLAYYRWFDWIAALSERAPDLRTLIADLKHLSPNATLETLERYLHDLDSQYSASGKNKNTGMVAPAIKVRPQDQRRTNAKITEK